MNLKSPIVLAIAAVLITLPLPLLTSPLVAQGPESQEAAKMVPANAQFTSTVDSQKMPLGSQFRARLENKVHLENGPELPSGTILVGQVVNDDTQSAGAAKLALRFTEADLKNGQTVPIKATIVNVFQAPVQSQASDYSTPENPLDWNAGTTVVDQIGVLSGVDLHSAIASPDSGVFVSTRKNDIKLSPQIGVELAIAPRDQQEATGGQ